MCLDKKKLYSVRLVYEYKLITSGNNVVPDFIQSGSAVVQVAADSINDAMRIAIQCLTPAVNHSHKIAYGPIPNSIRIIEIKESGDVYRGCDNVQH